MKKYLFTAIYAALMLIAASGCKQSASGDPEIERQLDGTWTTTYTETVDEDGEMMRTQMTETVTYDSKTHTMRCHSVASVTYPTEIKMFTFSGTGTWSADRNTLTEIYDEDSVDLTFHTGLLSKSDRKELEAGLRSELNKRTNFEIRSITPDNFTLFDGEDVLTYRRK